MTDIVELRESVELENRADLCAAACNFREASRLMKAANAIRSRHFGKLDPRELREQTLAALGGK
jgi:hypothetical protein